MKTFGQKLADEIWFKYDILYNGILSKEDTAALLDKRLASLLEIKERAHEWSANHPLEGTASHFDKAAANSIYQRCVDFDEELNEDTTGNQ